MDVLERVHWPDEILFSSLLEMPQILAYTASPKGVSSNYYTCHLPSLHPKHPTPPRAARRGAFQELPGFSLLVKVKAPENLHGNCVYDQALLALHHLLNSWERLTQSLTPKATALPGLELSASSAQPTLASSPEWVEHQP